MIQRNESIESHNKEKKTISTNFFEKKATCKTQIFYISLAFCLIIITLLMAVSIYCCFIECRAKKHLLSFHIPKNELKDYVLIT